jgi:hypothetical protein
MKLSATVLLTALCLALVACGGSDDKNPADKSEVASPAELTRAYGKLVGICLGTTFAGGAKFKERSEMRDQLRVIVASAEADPNAKSSDGQTAQEILFDTVPTLKECDEALALEAEDAATSN